MAIRASAAALALVLLSWAPASADAPTETLGRLFTAANRILADPATADQPMARLQAILRLVDGAFDFPGAAEQSLGPEWRARSVAEQREFVRLFADLLERAFVFRVATQANVSDGVKVRYLGESLDGEAASVETAVGTRDGGEVRLDYRMIERRGRWLVRDVVVDGISVVANYRAQFQRVIRDSSYLELVGQIRAKLADNAAVFQVAAREPERVPTEVDEPAPTLPAPAPPAVLVASPPVGPAPAPRAPRVTAVRATPPAYWVQVGAFKDLAAARRLAARLPQENVTLVQSQGRTAAANGLVHVRVGPFADRHEAVMKLLELQRNGYKPFILADQG